MKRPWPPTRKEIKTSALILVGSIVVMTFAGVTRRQDQGEALDPLFAILFGLLTGLALWLFLHVLILLPMKFIPFLTEKTDERGKRIGNKTKGAIIVRGGLWIYSLTFLTLQAMNIYETEGKHVAIKIIFGLFWLWMLSGVARGIKNFRDIVAFLLVGGVFWLYRFPEMVRGSLYDQLLAFQVLVGALLGLALLFSKDAGLYLHMQYGKIPPEFRKKLEKKKA